VYWQKIGNHLINDKVYLINKGTPQGDSHAQILQCKHLRITHSHSLTDKLRYINVRYKSDKENSYTKPTVLPFQRTHTIPMVYQIARHHLYS